MSRFPDESSRTRPWVLGPSRDDLGHPRAIILGIEHPRAVAAVQSLGRAGIPVVGVDHEAGALGFFSRYLSSKFQIETEPEKALDFLEALGREGGGMLMPTNDHYLILVSKNLDRLSQYFVVTTPPWETLRPLMDVARCYFEWRSADAIAQAHNNTAVQALWAEFGAVCDYRPLTSLAKGHQMFAEFDEVSL